MGIALYVPDVSDGNFVIKQQNKGINHEILLEWGDNDCSAFQGWVFLINRADENGWILVLQPNQILDDSIGNHVDVRCLIEHEEMWFNFKVISIKEH